MKVKIYFLCVILFSGTLLISCSQKNESIFHELKGPYLGQKPPGMTPELFAPDLITAGSSNGAIRFSPDGKEVIFYVSTPKGQQFLVEPTGIFQKHFIMYSHVENDRWTEPQELYFDPERLYHYFFISPDGKRIYFSKVRSESDPPRSRIWYVEKNDSEWTEPKEIDFGENYKGYGGSYISVAGNGNLYFSSWESGQGRTYVSRYQNGKYSIPKQLSEAVNDSGAHHSYVAPDESYLVFNRSNDLYVSFRDKDGNWLKAKNLGKKVNTEYLESRPFVSFDGKYLFFDSDRINPELPSEPVTLKKIQQLAYVPANGYQKIYWVDTKVIKKLRPDELK